MLCVCVRANFLHFSLLLLKSYTSYSARSFVWLRSIFIGRLYELVFRNKKHTEMIDANDTEI